LVRGGTKDEYRSVIDEAARYIERAGGVAALVRRYGKDRTFSIPILTHCALAGLLNWKDVRPLPFELACLPARFYKTVRLPVVSYALPALIAIGQVRHHFRKPRNPLVRMIRRLAARRSLNVLERIQPSNGGFLEATPLTSFVTMSLAGMGLAEHPVARRGSEFLIASVRPNGSWPIDTNLATWVTTLAVKALGEDLAPEARAPILRWLLDQQYREVHPYTNAAPGGWAWTDLPGGVPDADDTPGALLAVMELVESRDSRVEGREAISAGVRWLLDLQNRDGGWPTFCRGWGALPFDRSGPDLTAHALRALVRWFEGEFDIVPQAGLKCGWSLPDQRSWRPYRAIVNGFHYLERVQRPDGSWLPLWFGNQYAPNDENPTYGTARVLAAYRDAGRSDTRPARKGLEWLKHAQNADGGWGGAPGVPSSVEETALATDIVVSFEPHSEAAQRGIAWLLERIEAGTIAETCPIGFYFAKLWYFERLYPLIFTVSALRRAIESAAPNPPARTGGLQDTHPR
ncbi:MAG: squalene--hopene cyclase, partial [Planctomycetes bacterium]|nr:squalene--hopene cyclase [Planctomycetota bacterium]